MMLATAVSACVALGKNIISPSKNRIYRFLTTTAIVTLYISNSMNANAVDSFSISPSQLNVPWGNSVYTIAITSNTTWTILGSMGISHVYNPSTGFSDKIVTVTTNSMYMGNSYNSPTIQYGIGSYFDFGVLYLNKFYFNTGDLIVSSAAGSTFHHISSNSAWKIQLVGNGFSVFPTKEYGNATLSVTALNTDNTFIDLHSFGVLY